MRVSKDVSARRFSDVHGSILRGCEALPRSLRHEGGSGSLATFRRPLPWELPARLPHPAAPDAKRLKARSARFDPKLNQGRVISAPARQNRLVGALLEAHDGAEHDRVRVAFDDLLDQAIESRDRIGEDGRSGRERGPLRAVEAAGPMHAAVSAEAMGERLMARGEQVDREGVRLAQSGERRGRAREADDERRRRQRQGRERDDRAAGAVSPSPQAMIATPEDSARIACRKAATSAWRRRRSLTRAPR